MKEHEKCPKCGARKIYVVSEVSLLSDGHEVVALPVALASRWMEGVLTGGSTKILKGGHFQAWVCANCGFTEWYAQKLHQLDRLAEVTSAVRIIDHTDNAPPEGGPYR